MKVDPSCSPQAFTFPLSMAPLTHAMRCLSRLAKRSFLGRSGNEKGNVWKPMEIITDARKHHTVHPMLEKFWNAELHFPLELSGAVCCKVSLIQPSWLPEIERTPQSYRAPLLQRRADLVSVLCRFARFPTECVRWVVWSPVFIGYSGWYSLSHLIIRNLKPVFRFWPVNAVLGFGILVSFDQIMETLPLLEGEPYHKVCAGICNTTVLATSRTCDPSFLPMLLEKWI